MNSIAEAENQKILEFAHSGQPGQAKFYVYNAIEDYWAKWNGRKWTQKLCIERYDMI